MTSPAESTGTTPQEAAAALAALSAHRDTLADQTPRRSPWYYPAMGVLLGVSIAVGALHNPVVNAIALPFTLYAFASLAGIGDWLRVGISPRRLQGPQTVGLAVYLLTILPLVWGGALLLDRAEHHWALPVAGVAVPLLVTAGRLWITRVQRHRLLGR